jgi:uncharacterized protein with von Willebrand factor type A (vWA) domain
MSKSLTPHTPELSLAERLRQALAKNQPAANGAASASPPPPAARTCLLVDVSGSMAEDCEPGRRKIDALREVVATLGPVEMYAFSTRCLKASTVPEPGGCTNMALAFRRAKADGYDGVVIVTDGLPYVSDERRDEAAAMDAVRGLALQIFYVGPEPKPPFLDRLAAAARAGSQAHQSSLRKEARQKLATRVRGLLGPPA